MQLRSSPKLLLVRDITLLSLNALLCLGAIYLVFVRPLNISLPVFASPASSSENSPSSAVAANIGGIPASISFPTIDHAIGVVPSHVDTKTSGWPLSHTAVHYATFTPDLNAASGTTVLYGHNQPSILRPLENVRLGDGVSIIDQSGVESRFVLNKIETVSPRETGFIYEQTPHRVVLITCYGLFDEFRKLYFLEPILTTPLQQQVQ